MKTGQAFPKRSCLGNPVSVSGTLLLSREPCSCLGNPVPVLGTLFLSREPCSCLVNPVLVETLCPRISLLFFYDLDLKQQFHHIVHHCIISFKLWYVSLLTLFFIQSSVQHWLSTASTLRWLNLQFIKLYV